MIVLEINAHVAAPGKHRWHRLRLNLPEKATREDVLNAVADEFTRRDEDFYARQGRLPL